jgi:hypothetical protein
MVGKHIPLVIRPLAHQLERGLKELGGTHTLKDIELMVSAGALQKWEGEESLIFTRVVQSPQKKECVIFLAVGNMPEIERLHPIVISWAKAQGCDRVVFAGRLGWAKTFLTRQKGWQAKQTLYSKEL